MPHDWPRPSGDRVLPDCFATLEATLGPAARGVTLDDVRVVRTTARPDHAPGNAVHHLARLASDGLEAAADDLDRRFPTGRARLVVPHDADLVVAAGGRGLQPSVVEVVLRPADATAQQPRGDVTLSAPSDDREWHGITVLQRHAALPGDDRARGAADDRLRWWVDGLRELVEHGRARVLRAERFGTPVGAGVLHWAPGTEVGAGHAGLAVVAGVVVHPAHRGLGIARAIADALVGMHLAEFPRARVAGVAEHAVDEAHQPEVPALPSGWRRHGRLLALTRTDAPAAAGGRAGGRR